MIMGGAVQGGKLTAHSPTRPSTDRSSLSRGQFIPSTSVDQDGSNLARWMGVTRAATSTPSSEPGQFLQTHLGFIAAVSAHIAASAAA